MTDSKAYAPLTPTHPLLNPAIAVELTMREREALMTRDDWSEQIDRVLSWPLEYVRV